MLLLVRPKFYMMFSPQVQVEVFQNYGGDLRAWLEDNLSIVEDSDPITDFIPKFALHGFWDLQ